MILSGPDRNGVQVDVVSGVPDVLACLPALQGSFERWGQLAEFAELPFLLSVPISPRRKPLLLLLRRAGANTGDATNLVGAVLLFAYGASLFGNRLLAHPDRTGRRCVFGPAPDRTAIATMASRALLERGAALLILPYRVADERDVGPEEELISATRRQNALCALGMMGADPKMEPKLEWTVQGVTRRLDLPLEPELDITLQRVGKRTRRNLRAATRHSIRDMGAQFQWNPELSVADLADINAECTHPVRRGVVRWRHTVGKQLPGAFLAGLRSAAGEWMALAGGRRIGDAVVLDWQMNRKCFARFSVSLVMRGLLISRLGGEGVTRMRFEGGTTHTLVRGFRTGAVFTLRVQQRSFWLSALEKVLTTWLPGRAITRDLFGSGRPSAPDDGLDPHGRFP